MVRADFPPFALETVEHSRHLPLLFSALRHFMVAKDSIAPEAGFEKSAPFYGEKMAHFITSKERQIDEL